MSDENSIEFQIYLDIMIGVLEKEKHIGSVRMWNLLYEVMLEENSNVPEEIVKKVQSIKNRVVQEDNCDKIETASSSINDKNSALSYITKKQK